MGLAEMPQHAGDRYVGVADAVAEPVFALRRGALRLQHVERAVDLAAAALDP